MRYASRRHGVEDPTGELATMAELLAIGRSRLGELNSKLPSAIHQAVSRGDDADWEALERLQAEIRDLTQVLSETTDLRLAQVAMPKPGRVAQLAEAFSTM